MTTLAHFGAMLSTAYVQELDLQDAHCTCALFAAILPHNRRLRCTRIGLIFGTHALLGNALSSLQLATLRRHSPTSPSEWFSSSARFTSPRCTSMVLLQEFLPALYRGSPCRPSGSAKCSSQDGAPSVSRIAIVQSCPSTGTFCNSSAG